MDKATKKLLEDIHKKGIEKKERRLKQLEENLLDLFKKNPPFEISQKSLELFEATIESSKKTSH